jgi:hypothetical protein
MIDLSNGLTLMDEERNGLHVAIAELQTAASEAERRLALATALHTLKAAAPALALIGPEGAALVALVELVLTKLGVE